MSAAVESRRLIASPPAQEEKRPQRSHTGKDQQAKGHRGAFRGYINPLDTVNQKWNGEQHSHADVAVAKKHDPLSHFDLEADLTVVNVRSPGGPSCLL